MFFLLFLPIVNAWTKQDFFCVLLTCVCIIFKCVFVCQLSTFARTVLQPVAEHNLRNWTTISTFERSTHNITIQRSMLCRDSLKNVYLTRRFVQILFPKTTFGVYCFEMCLRVFPLLIFSRFRAHSRICSDPGKLRPSVVRFNVAINRRKNIRPKSGTVCV